MFDRCLYFNINALTRLVNKEWNTAFSELDLSPSHGYLLRVVLSKPGITQKELASELKLEKSTITRFIDTLQKKGFLIRKSEGVDARQQNIHPTNKTKDLQDSLENTGDYLYEKILSKIGKEQLTLLVNLLKENEKKIK